MTRRPHLPVVAALALAACGGGTPADTGPPRDIKLDQASTAGTQAMSMELPDVAVRQYKVALARAYERDDSRAIADVAFNLALAQTKAGDAKGAVATAQAAEAELDRRRTPVPAELSLVKAAASYRSGDSSGAMAAARQALDRQASDPDVVPRAWFIVGLVAADQDDAPRSRRRSPPFDRPDRPTLKRIAWSCRAAPPCSTAGPPTRSRHWIRRRPTASRRSTIAAWRERWRWRARPACASTVPPRRRTISCVRAGARCSRATRPRPCRCSGGRKNWPHDPARQRSPTRPPDCAEEARAGQRRAEQGGRHVTQRLGEHFTGNGSVFGARCVRCAGASTKTRFRQGCDGKRYGRVPPGRARGSPTTLSSRGRRSDPRRRRSDDVAAA